MKSVLDQLSLNAACEGDGLKLEPEDTRRELDKSLREYYAWNKKYIDGHLDSEEQNIAYDVIWSLVSAYRHCAYEDGFRACFRLMQDACCDPRSICDVETAAQKECE